MERLDQARSSSWSPGASGADEPDHARDRQGGRGGGAKTVVVVAPFRRAVRFCSIFLFLFLVGLFWSKRRGRCFRCCGREKETNFSELGLDQTLEYGVQRADWPTGSGMSVIRREWRVGCGEVQGSGELEAGSEPDVPWRLVRGHWLVPCSVALVISCIARQC